MTQAQARDTKKKPAELLEHSKPEDHQGDAGVQLHTLLHLQRRAGNRAVVGLLESHGQLQTKLRSSAPVGVIQRKCATCSPTSQCASCEEEERLQRKPKAIGSAPAPHIQRAPRNGDSAGVSTPETATEPEPAAGGGPLIVEDDAATVAPDQMRKSEFLEQLRSSVCTTADEALAEAGQSSEGCPYIEQWFSHYADKPPAHIERALRKYAPGANSATSARDYIPAVSNRVRQGIATWARTGELTGVPEELQSMLSGPGAALGAIGGMLGSIGSAIGGAITAAAGAIGGAFSSIGRALFKRKEGQDRANARATNDTGEIQQQLSGGQPLDGGAKSRMGGAFGHDFSNVRVHTNSEAAGLSDSLNARAFTVGSDIAFGAGEYQPGTLIGDALIAHELAHVVQQSGGGNGSSPQSKGDAGHDALEEEADVSAVGAVSKLWLGAQGALGEIGRNAMPRMRSGLQLQRCPSATTTSVRRPQQPAAHCAPITPAEWTRQVNEAVALTDAGQKRTRLGALAQQALCPLNIQVHIAGRSNTGAVDPADYQPAPVVNFDMNLEGKNRWGRTGRTVRPVGHQPAYYFSSGSIGYAIIGPLAINPETILDTRQYAEHELYHTEHHLRTAEGEDDTAELETWTHDFRNYFHQYLLLPITQRPVWEPLMAYYENTTSDDARGRALDQLVDYYNNPPGTTDEERTRVRTGFARWHRARLRSNPSRRLLVDLENRLHLGSP